MSRKTQTYKAKIENTESIPVFVDIVNSELDVNVTNESINTNATIQNAELDVNVTNESINANVSGSVTVSDITGGKIALVNEAGDYIETGLDAEGDLHLSVGMIQEILSSSKNTTTDNLNAGETFTGDADETFGVNGIQVYLFADQDCTITIEQSIDAINWDVQDSWECLANHACTQTIQSVAPYYRAKLTNNGTSATTALRFATGMTPVINPLPRKLTDDDRLSTESTLTGKENTDRHVWVTPTNALNTVETVRLVGTNFDGTTKDTNFWTETVTNGGTVTQAGGEIELDTNTTANATTKYSSVRSARFVSSSPLKFQGSIKIVTAPTINNQRRFGAYTSTDGFFFLIDGTTFKIGYRKGGVDTPVSNGSFNGNYGPTWTVDVTGYHRFEIEWGPKGIFFYIDGKLLHKDGQGHRSNFLTLPITIENNNINGQDANIALDALACAIVRYGNLLTSPTYKYLGANATYVLKYGAGILQKIINLDNAGDVTVYDNTSATGTQIAVIDTAKTLGTLNFGAPFSTGLTIVVNGAKITVIYE